MSILHSIEIELKNENDEKTLLIDAKKSIERITSDFIEQGYLPNWARYRKDNRTNTKNRYGLAIKLTNYDHEHSIKFQFNEEEFKGNIYLNYDDTKIELLTFLSLYKSLYSISKIESGYEYTVKIFNNIRKIDVTFIQDGLFGNENCYIVNIVK